VHQFKNVFRLLLLVIQLSPLAATSVLAVDNPFAWDLSYAAVFKANNVPENDTMLKYFIDADNRKGNSKDMYLPDELFSDIDMAAIKKAILVDYQAYWYMGHRSAALFLDFGESVSVRMYDSKSNKIRFYEIKPEYFVDFSQAMMHRNQSLPYGGYEFQVMKGYSFAGYIGVISTFWPDDRNQQLIAIEDLLNKQMEQGELGKLLNVVQRKMKLADDKK
jgi:hypothetical protein